jgi:hypothetical protein
MNINIETKTELISPEQAREILSQQKGNRKLSSSFVEYLAREIVSDNWKLTHQGICFDESGHLIDGQHRLAAIVKANKAILTLVTRGVSREDSLRAVDQGRLRTRGQLFGMRNEKNAVMKASICRSMSIFLNPDLPYSSSLGPSEDAAILHEYRNAIEKVITLGVSSKRMSARFYAVAALLYNYDEDLGLSFINGVTIGADLSKGDPRLTLRNWLLGETANRMSSSADGAGIIVKAACAVAAYVDGENLINLKVTPKRYARFCDLLGLPRNKSLFTYCGGNLQPTKKSPSLNQMKAKKLESQPVEPIDPSDSRDLSDNQLQFITDWT